VQVVKEGEEGWEGVRGWSLCPKGFRGRQMYTYPHHEAPVCQKCNLLADWQSLVFVQKGGSREIRFRCMKCQQIIGDVMPKSILVDWDVNSKRLETIVVPVVKSSRRRGGKKIRKHVVEVERIEQVSDLRKLPYAEYLKTDHWKRMSAMCKRNADYRCQICNSTKALEAHHRTYERLGWEAPGDLTCLCGACHAKFHNKPG